MNTSILTARILALVYLAVVVGHCTRRDYFQPIMKDFLANSGLLYLGGFMALVLGAILVHAHNLWVSDWRVLVTIVGWLALIKGVILISFPGLVKKFAFIGSLGICRAIMVAACAVLGLLFAWFGWLA